MNTVINKIQSNPFLAVIFAILSGILVLLISQPSANLLVSFFQNHFELNFYTNNVVFKFFMLVYSIVIILIINQGKLKGYGFNMPENTRYLRLILITSGITIASLIIGNLFFLGLMNHLFPVDNTSNFPEQKSILQMVLTIWIWSSLCEEIMVKGLVQSFIQKFNTIKFLKLSLPVLVSGIFFGAMHFSLYLKGMGIWFVCSIMFFTTSIGLLAAYYREKSNSLVPAFVVHFMANVVGSTPLIISLLIK